MNSIFIYGSLGPGGPNEYRMIEIGGIWMAATTKGRFVSEGWGAELGFPAIVPDENGDVIEGHLFMSSNLDGHWADLDEFEGDAYERVKINVTLETGNEVQTCVYALRTK